MCDESYCRRVKMDGLCFWFWCGDDGDGNVWFCCCFLCVEEDYG